MNACNEHESMITEVVSGAAAEGDRLRLEDHMERCAACKAEFTKAHSLLATLSPNRADPGESFWQNYYGSLTARMESDTVVPTGSGLRPVRATGSALRQRMDRLAGRLVPRPRWAVQLVAAVLLVATGVLLGRTLWGPAVNGSSVATNDTSNQDVIAAALELRTQAYLDRSKTLLLGLVNFDTSEDDPSRLNFERRQAMAGSLLQEASFLQERLTPADNQQLHQLISDLEIILMQIANIESAYDIPEIEIVQSGMDRKAILFKIEVEEMRRDDAVQLNSKAELEPSSV